MIKEGVLKSYLPNLPARRIIQDEKNSYLLCNDLGQFSVTAFTPALKWYFRHLGPAKLMQNPALTLALETAGETEVNTLLKCIDHINLIKDKVLLIGATNHAGMLDEAALAPDSTRSSTFTLDYIAGCRHAGSDPESCCLRYSRHARSDFTTRLRHEPRAFQEPICV